MILACVAGLGGCAQRSQVWLEQPQLPGRQRTVQLLSEQGYWAEEGGIRRLLVEFPLPGAATGRPNYLLYIRMPAGVATRPAEGAPSVSGFLIQTRGEEAGLAVLSHARISVRNGKSQRYAVELLFDDDTRISGQVFAERDEWRLRFFETEQRPVDVAAAASRQIRLR